MTRSRAAHAADIEKMTGANLEAFQEGVKSVLRQWTVLELGIYHQWGGNLSAADVYNDLYTQLMNLFFGTNKFYKDDVLLLLEDYIEDKFNILCEDGSPDELSQLFCMLWAECIEGNHNSVRVIMSREQQRQSVVQQSRGIQDGDAMDSDDDDDDGNMQELNQMYKSQVQHALSGQAPPDMNGGFTFGAPAPEQTEGAPAAPKKNNRRRRAVEATEDDWGETEVTGFVQMDEDAME